MLKTVIHNNDVVYCAADIHTQSTERDDKDKENAKKYKPVVINDTINDAMSCATFDSECNSGNVTSLHI